MRIFPSSNSFIKEGVVAITLVSEAASNMVSMVIGSRAGTSARCAVSFAMENFPVVADHQHGSRDQAVAHGLIDGCIEGRRKPECLLPAQDQASGSARKITPANFIAVFERFPRAKRLDRNLFE